MELKKFELFSLYNLGEITDTISRNIEGYGKNVIGEDFLILRSIDEVGYVVSFVLHSHTPERGFVYRCIYTGFK